MRKKLAVKEEIEHHSREKSHPEVTGTQTEPHLRPSVQTSNYMDCTESNDDEEGEDDEEKEELPRDAGQSFAAATHTSSCLVISPPPLKPTPPSWSTFFTAEPVVTDDSCELENSQNSQAVFTDRTTSQSPELFNDDDESESGHVTSSQSTYVSETALESLSQLDTVPLQSNAMHLHWPVEGQPDSTVSHQDQCDDTEPVSESQVSSDFDLPMTPGSKAPHPEELKELYRKLAAEEDLTTKNHQQGSV